MLPKKVLPKKVPTTFGQGVGALRLRLHIPAKPATVALSPRQTHSENHTEVSGMYGGILVMAGGRQLKSFSRQPSRTPILGPVFSARKTLRHGGKSAAAPFAMAAATCGCKTIVKTENAFLVRMEKGVARWNVLRYA